MTAVELFHVPPSFYSQVARLALVEKGAPWRSRITAAGPPSFDNYAPWFVAIQPEMTVPAMRHGATAVPGSLAIARYVDAHFDGPRLLPDDAAEVERWIAAYEQLSIRVISYGTMSGSSAPARLNGMRLRALRRARARAPELAALYDAKIADIEGFAASAANPEDVARQRALVDGLLDALERALAERTFVAGASYTLADVVWTVTVARLRMLKLDPLAGRPALAAWYERMRARPSFDAADVWERFKVHKLLAAVTRRYARTLGLVAVITLALIGWALAS